MTACSPSVVSRRQLLQIGCAAAAASTITVPAFASASRPTSLSAVPGIRPEIWRRALAAFEKHGSRIAQRDMIGIADFSVPSGKPRFHLVDMTSGKARTLLVSHGRGSDPKHSGWVERFSNQPGSAASSDGAYVTGDEYVGQHGRSRRLQGLDATNNNAFARAVVIHSAWYVSPAMVAQHGKLGRSEGCFAFDTADLGQVMAKLGAGRMIYADKA
jgi:hypothetical protein